MDPNEAVNQSPMRTDSEGGSHQWRSMQTATRTHRNTHTHVLMRVQMRNRQMPAFPSPANL